jgi:hypothetical protein
MRRRKDAEVTRSRGRVETWRIETVQDFSSVSILPVSLGISRFRPLGVYLGLS